MLAPWLRADEKKTILLLYTISDGKAILEVWANTPFVPSPS